MQQDNKIKEILLAELPKHSSDIVAVAAKKCRVTRTTIHRHLQALIQAGKVIKSGTTKNTHYMLASSHHRKLTYALKPGLDESMIFSHDFKTILISFSTNLQDMISYSFTEIVNNAIDHSKGKVLTIKTLLKKNHFILSIQDDGIGIFKNIYDYFHLDDMRESILQLTKGKTTTDPMHHTGEGIFFSSRLPDTFEITANGLYFLKDNKKNDWAIAEDSTLKHGSRIVMSYDLKTTLDLVNIFKQYQDEEDFSFNRTEIIVQLSQLQEEVLISRSQAKRILRNLDKFQKITLDFTGVRLVGQGFVDEIFRVYCNLHPETKIQYIHANNDVKFMIERQRI